MNCKIKKIANARWPTLQTLLMIEAEIAKGKEKNKREIWISLPKKVMWQTYLTALSYLENTGQIGTESGKLVIKKKSEENKGITEPKTPSYVY